METERNFVIKSVENPSQYFSRFMKEIEKDEHGNTAEKADAIFTDLLHSWVFLSSVEAINWVKVLKSNKMIYNPDNHNFSVVLVDITEDRIEEVVEFYNSLEK